ncbi:MAG: acetate kinase [Pseudanabaenaceae cyanobacterium bins.68]|nr:acetate kinase [Pseudanabaenaceae cyanobacterium bins.68]
MKILVLNAGSSSLKASLYDQEHQQKRLCQGSLDYGWANGLVRLQVQNPAGDSQSLEFSSRSRLEDLQQLLDTLSQLAGWTSLVAVELAGHRVVHGGRRVAAALVDADLKAEIRSLSQFAPLHNSINLAGIEAIEQLLGVPQVAVFDTAFHSQIPDFAHVYPGSYEWLALGIRRYGFHGISHQYCVGRAAEILATDLKKLRLISCHLGNGCSLAAIKNGVSVDTTMGFTPLDGLMMGTRSGAIDPGILLYLLKEHHYTPDQLDDLLNRQSGLLGISGVAADLRQLEDAIAEGNPRAKLAVEIFVHRVRQGIGAMAASLGGIDGVIFTGGIGENSARVRAAVCEGLKFFGIDLDLELNQRSPIDPHIDLNIARHGSPVGILVIHTQEDLEIARQSYEVYSAKW